jgi:hypothetical protein
MSVSAYPEMFYPKVVKVVNKGVAKKSAAPAKLTEPKRALKRRWEVDEVVALRQGALEHGSNWIAIVNDPSFSSILRYRSNVDLKDKWRLIKKKEYRTVVRAVPVDPSPDAVVLEMAKNETWG